MRLIQFLNIAVLLLFFACKTKKESTTKQTYKDSVLQQYINYTSQQPYFFDKSNYDYRFLIAYYRNDTAFLKKASNDMAVSDKKKGDGFPDSCRRHPIIEQLKSDYVYQFDYSESFCNLAYYFTIIKNKDTVILQSVIYQGGNEMESCKIVKENSKKLTQENWDEFIASIQFADFWGLNQYKEIGCCDGNFLTVKAIERNWQDHTIIKQQKVARQFVFNTALFKSCELLAKFSNWNLKCKL